VECPRTRGSELRWRTGRTLPGTLGPTPLIGVGYFGIIVAAVLVGGLMIARPHWLAWAAAGAVAVSAMGGYILTRALPGGFLGDHGDVGNWHCPLGIAALSVETLIILLVLLAAWLGRVPAASVAAQSRKEYEDAHVLT